MYLLAHTYLPRCSTRRDYALAVREGEWIPRGYPSTQVHLVTRSAMLILSPIRGSRSGISVVPTGWLKSANELGRCVGASELSQRTAVRSQVVKHPVSMHEFRGLARSFAKVLNICGFTLDTHAARAPLSPQKEGWRFADLGSLHLMRSASPIVSTRVHMKAKWPHSKEEVTLRTGKVSRCLQYRQIPGAEFSMAQGVHPQTDANRFNV